MIHSFAARPPRRALFVLTVLTGSFLLFLVQPMVARMALPRLGGAPAVPGQQLNATVTAQSRLQTAEQFGAILLKTQSNGATVHLRDVAKMELGRENYATVARFNGKPATGIALKLATGANAHPVLPELAGRGRFAGSIIHSRDYRNPSAWQGRRVLVVGMGNTGAEIALDLVEHGACVALR